MPSKFTNIRKLKDKMTLEQKKRVLKALKALRECGNIGGTTDIVPDGVMGPILQEDQFTSLIKPESNSIAKTFAIKANFDDCVNKHLGIEMTDKEMQAILGFKRLRPTHQDKFSVEYESTNNFGKNNKTIIKKLKDGDKFCFTAFSKHEPTEDKNKQSDSSLNELAPAPLANQGKPKPTQSKPVKLPPKPVASKPIATKPTTNKPAAQPPDVTVDDSIRVTKSTTFVNDSDGSNMLGDFLLKLDL